MKSRFKMFGHPVHPMLVVFPLGLLVTSVIFDGIALATKKKDYAKTSHKLIGAGVLGGLAAAVPGLVDYLAIPDNTRAKRVGFWHGSGNVILLLLFGASWQLRREKPEEPSPLALGLSLAGILLGNVTAWLGGELIYRLGVSVDKGAHLDAHPSLLTDE